MANEPEYTIGALAQAAGVTPRTIRYYTAEGLLPQPESRGRYARYTEEHLRRLQQIIQLKEHYLPLHVIRERLAAGETAGPAPHPGDHTPASPLRLHTPGPPHSLRPSTPSSPASSIAADAVLVGQATMSGGQHGAQGQELQLGRYQFFPDLPEPEDASGSTVSAKMEQWQRIALTPGVELHLKEPLGEERRRRLEALIAAARDILSGDDDA